MNNILKYTVPALLLSFVFVFLSPFTSHAAVAEGDTFSFSTGNIFLDHEQKTWTETKQIDLGENYTGTLRLFMTVNQDTVVNETVIGGASSYQSQFTLIVNGVEYQGTKDAASGSNNFRFTVPVSNTRYIGLKWTLIYWGGYTVDPDYDLRLANFSSNVTIGSIGITLNENTNYIVKDNQLNDNVNDLKTKLQTWFDNVVTSVTNLQSKLQTWFTNLNTNIDNFESKVNSLFTQLFNRMDEDQEELVNGYDESVGNTANSDFNNSSADLEAAENSLFENTSYDQIDYNQFNTFFTLETVSGAILFVKSALEAIYSSLGVFGIPISIGLVLLVFTRLIGFQNFKS